MATQDISDMSVEWDDAMVDFVGIKLDVTNTDSGVNSQLIRLSVDGDEMFSVYKSGVIYSIADMELGGVLAIGTESTPLMFSNPGLLVFQKWNSGAAVFTALKLNVTDMASDTASLLLDLQVGGASKFSVNKYGSLVLEGGIQTSGGFAIQIDSDTGLVMEGGLFAGKDIVIGWTSGNPTDPVDVGLARAAAGVVEVNDGTPGSYAGTALKTGGQLVSELPAAATAGVGARAFVTDALLPVALAIVAGSGAVKVPVYSDGANWLVG